MSFEIPSRRGQDHPLAKMSNNERQAVRTAFQAGERINDLARLHGVDRRTISRIAHQPADWLPRRR